jgi:hypothetical protein
VIFAPSRNSSSGIPALLPNHGESHRSRPSVLGRSVRALPQHKLGRTGYTSRLPVRPLSMRRGARMNKPSQKFRYEFDAPTSKDCLSLKVSLVHVAKHEPRGFQDVGKVFQEQKSA